jgi:GTP-binding protein
VKASDTFVDEVEISVASGRGGDGYVGFRREKFIPAGGPDGGDGGRGADVVLVADEGENTLLAFRNKRSFQAPSGRPGEAKHKTGADGETIEIRMPVGTIVYDAEQPEDAAPIADLAENGQRVVVARGGAGGRGNLRFKTPTRRAPDFATPGRDGEERALRLSLKLIADIGLVGLPNAGKSTLLRRVSSARPRVADYPFTTLVPALGVAESGERRFVVADIPGLIEGASDGAGLGDRFLRHIERTRVLVHLLDLGAATLDGRDPLDDYDSIRHELGAYDPSLLDRTEIVALNKLDLVADREAIARLESDLRSRGCETIGISAATGEGVAELVQRMAQILDSLDAADAARDAEVTA